MFVLSAKLTVQESGIDRCIEGLQTIVQGVNGEPGAIRYDIHRSKEVPNQFMVYEIYSDETAFKAHLDSDHYNQLIETVGELLECPPVLEMWEHLGSIDR